jgi:magnesium chelatase family protein
MLSRVHSATLRGIDAALVSVEVDVTSELPSFATVGLPDSAVRESRTLWHRGCPFPATRA